MIFFHALPLDLGGIYRPYKPTFEDMYTLSFRSITSWFRLHLLVTYGFLTQKTLAVELAVLVLEAVKCLKKVT